MILIFLVGPGYKIEKIINNFLATNKKFTVSTTITMKVKKAAPKASTVTIMTNGEVIVWKVRQGNYVHNSEHAVHTALLPFNGAAGMSCFCCNLVGINKRYLPICYIQSYGEKCKYHGIMCACTPSHIQLTNTTIGDAFFLTILTEIQVELQQKLLEVKVAADCPTDH